MRVKFCSVCGRMAMLNFVFCPWCGQEFELPQDEEEAVAGITQAVERCEELRDRGMDSRIRGLERSLEDMDRDLEGFILSGIECRLGLRGDGESQV